MEDRRLTLFGTRKQTQVLIVIALLEEVHLRELIRLVGMGAGNLSRLVDRLELQNVLATRTLGSERRISLNPKFFAYKPLKELLMRLSVGEPELLQELEEQRRRPRRKGKPILEASA